MVLQNYQNFIEMTLNMIYIVALGVGLKCPHKIHSGRSHAGGVGGLKPPQFSADQLTLSRPGGTHYPHPVLVAPPVFQTLRRPCHLNTQWGLGGMEGGGCYPKCFVIT
jgi:hypothetical protein